MSKPEEKFIYRIKAQTKDNGITITAQTSKEMVHAEAVSCATKDVLLSKLLGDHYSNFIVEPICTEQEWKDGVANFCPRCGASLKDYQRDSWLDTECDDCGAEFDVSITTYDEEDDV